VIAHLPKGFLAVAAASALALSSWAQQAQPAQGQQQGGQAAQPAKPAEPQWKDRAEYDLVQEINKTTDPAKKLALLNSWKEKYPNTEFKIPRMQMYVIQYQQLGQGDNMIQAAKDLVAADPKNLLGLYWINVLTISLGKTTPEALAEGEKAANSMLSNLNDMFAADKKPANVSEADWKKQRADSEALAHKTLGWVAMSRNNHELAETEFVKSLQLKPNDAQVSFWLGSSVLAQKKPEKQAPALFHFARAVSVPGQPPDALPEADRKKIMAYLEKIYTTYHGSKDGLTDLLALAKTNALPPADLKIEDANTIAARKQKEFIENNPQLALWMNLKQQVINEEGYFDSTVKGAAVPKLKGKVVSQKPATRPTAVVVAIEKPDTPEVTLKFETPLPGPAEPGTEIQWQGVPSEFTKEPFMMTFDVERDKLEGWPAPPAKKAPGRKKR
jgi:hypothetical protein